MHQSIGRVGGWSWGPNCFVLRGYLLGQFTKGSVAEVETFQQQHVRIWSSLILSKHLLDSDISDLTATRLGNKDCDLFCAHHNSQPIFISSQLQLQEMSCRTITPNEAAGGWEDERLWDYAAMQLNIILQVCGDIFWGDNGHSAGCIWKGHEMAGGLSLVIPVLLGSTSVAVGSFEAVNLGRAPSLVAFNVTLAIFTTWNFGVMHRIRPFDNNSYFISCSQKQEQEIL